MDKAASSPIEWQGAPRGMVKNAPQEDLPGGCVARVENAICYPTEWVSRNGTRVAVCSDPPALTGRTNYGAIKVGNRIIADDDIFSAADIGHYWVWPGEPDLHEEIQVYESANTVQVSGTGDRDHANGCWMHARLNLFKFHRVARRFVFQWGEAVYIAEAVRRSDGRLGIVNRTLMLCTSVGATPWNCESTWDERDRYGMIFNPGGMFLIDFDTGLMFKENTAIPQTLLEGNVRSKTKVQRYSYIYAMARLSGQGMRSRVSPGMAILQQSGSTKLQGAVGSERDYADIWTVNPVGTKEHTTGKLTGGTMNHLHCNPGFWSSLAAPGASFKATVNGIESPFEVDCSPAGHDVHTMDDVAAAMQEEMRSVFPFVTAIWDDDHFVFTAGPVDGSTMGFMAAGLTGTDVSGYMHCRSSYATIDNSYKYEQYQQVGVYAIPFRENTVGIATTTRERHWTHYVALRTTDIGLNGANSRVNPLTGECLNPVSFTWVADVRVAGAFWASMTDGIIEAAIGEFELADEGASFEWEDGEIDTLGTYIDSHHMRVQADYYYDKDKPLQAAAIGGGRVVRVTQSGHTVTRVSGDNFAGLAVGDTIWTSTLQERVITEIIDDDTLRVNTSDTLSTQGLTCLPISRVINDFTSDETLRNRQGKTIVGFWEYRYHSAMPNAGLGVATPGFVITAKVNEGKLYYCQQRVSEKYMTGYHLDSRQTNDRIRGQIQWLAKTTNKFIAWCKDSTWGGATNTSESNIKKFPELGYSYAVLYADVINDRIGVVDAGSIAPVADGVFQMRCQDGSFRKFNGTTYSVDLTMDPETYQDRIKRDLGDTWPQSASIYSDKNNLGHILWLKQKAT
jgi:hypothetical protein